MGANQSTQQDQQEATMVVEETQEWREPAVEAEEEGDWTDDEPLDSEEEEEYRQLLIEEEILDKLAIMRSTRPIEFADSVDPDIRVKAALRSQEIIAAALARAEARLGEKIDYVPRPFAVLMEEPQAKAQEQPEAEAQAPAQPAVVAAASAGTPFKMPVPPSAAKSGAKSTGKKRLATLRKRVAELREIEEGCRAEETGYTPVRRLNFKEPAEEKPQDESAQTEIQQQMASLDLNTNKDITEPAPTEATEPAPVEAHMATPPTSSTPEPESTPVAPKSSGRSTRANVQGDTPARSTRSKRADRDNKENVGAAPAAAKGDVAGTVRRGRRTANTAN